MLKLILPLFFLTAMLGFEVARDMTIFFKTNKVNISLLNNLNEEDESTGETDSSEETFFDLDLSLRDFRSFALIRETIRVDIIDAHELKYQLLSQKVLLPPPKFYFS